MRVTGRHPSDVDGPIQMEAVRWKFYFVSLHSFHQYCGRSLGSLLALCWSVRVMPRFSLILTTAYFMFPSPWYSHTFAECQFLITFPSFTTGLIPPILEYWEASLFFFSLLMIMSVCSLVLRSYPQTKNKKGRVWASMFLFKFAIWSGELALFEQHRSV